MIPFFFLIYFFWGFFLGTETFFSSLYNLYRPIVCVCLCLCLPRPRSGRSGRCTNLPIIYNNYTLTGEQGSLLWGDKVLANSLRFVSTTQERNAQCQCRERALRGRLKIRSIAVRCLAKYGLLSVELTAYVLFPATREGGCTALHCTARALVPRAGARETHISDFWSSHGGASSHLPFVA